MNEEQYQQTIKDLEEKIEELTEDRDNYREAIADIQEITKKHY